MIYFDNGATTYPKPPTVLKGVNDAIKRFGANPGRGGHDMSIKTANEIFLCRQNLATLFNVKDVENVIFTLNCTQSLNTVIKGILKKGDHVVVSSLEHNSVMRPLKAMSDMGVTYSVAKVYACDDDKTINSFRNEINEKTKLVICTHASNVFGIRLPIERICALAHQYGILFCADCAQSAGVLPIDVDFYDYDFVCCAGHKGLYGPMGVGVLIINTDNLPIPLMFGGTGSSSVNMKQPSVLPDKYESGTPNVVGICGLKRGTDFVLSKTTDKIFTHEMSLISYLYKRLKQNKNIILYTDEPDTSYFAPVLSFSVKDFSSEDVSAYLNQKYSIAVRAGLHCSPLAHKYMNTLENGTVRVCPSVFNNKNQIDILVNALEKIGNKNIL